MVLPMPMPMPMSCRRPAPPARPGRRPHPGGGPTLPGARFLPGARPRPGGRPRRASPGLLAGLLCGLLALAAPAGAEPPPRAADMVQAEILPGWRQGGTHLAGLRLRLAPKWKTYWRSPGEAGVPPVFDFSASENLAGVEVLWPAPRLFSLNGLRTLGYAREVVLPIRVTPRDAGREVRLAGQVELGLCRDICLPVTLGIDARLPAGAQPHDPAIAAALEALPRAGVEAGLSSLRCRVEPIRDGLRLTAELDLPPQGGEEMAVIETADPAIWVSEAETRRSGRRLTAAADLVPASGAPFLLDRSGLRLTVVGEQGTVDIAGCPAG